MTITITEALAEIKTIGKRIDKKREFMFTCIARPDGARDPHEKDGGSVSLIKREMQAVVDLEKRIIELRSGINAANDSTFVEIGGVLRTIADWLTWRRDIAPKRKSFLEQMQRSFEGIRSQAKKQGAQVVTVGAASISESVKPTDIIVNVSEREIADQIEDIETVLGQLDGQLSLKNATVFIIDAIPPAAPETRI